MEKIKEFLKDQREEIWQGLSDISADFVTNYKYDNIGGDIDDAFHEFADSAVAIYYDDLFEWAKHNFEWIDRAHDELGKSGDIIRDLQAGQLLQYLDNLYNNREKIVVVCAAMLLLDNTEAAELLGLERLQEFFEEFNFNQVTNFDDLGNWIRDFEYSKELTEEDAERLADYI